EKAGVPLDGSTAGIYRPIILSSVIENLTFVKPVNYWEGIYLLRSPDLGKRVVEAPHPHERKRIPLVTVRAGRIDFQRPPVMLFRVRPVPVTKQLRTAQKSVAISPTRCHDFP